MSRHYWLKNKQISNRKLHKTEIHKACITLKSTDVLKSL